jgi:hypothetical protein
MKSQRQKGQDKKRLQDAFEEMYEELHEWREKHPEASFDEIANQVTPRRRELMGELLELLAGQHGSGEVPEGVVCEKCGAVMEYKGEPERDVGHLEAETRLSRAYYNCPHCEGGVFPPGPQIRAGEA